MPASPLKSKHTQNATSSNQNGKLVTPTATAQYEEAQADEIEALRAIYMEDFTESQTKGAWHKAGERTFKLTLRASSDESVFVTLNCTLPVTYPKSLPSLSIDNHKVKDKVLDAVQTILKTKPRQMVGQVMIHEVATDIQDILEDAGDARALDSQLPSLEEERAQTEAVALAAARQKQADDLQRQEEARQEEERTMQRMVEDEFRRRQDARKKIRTESSQDNGDFEISTAADLTFDHSVNATDPSIGTFRALSIVSFRGQGPLTKVLLAKPVSHTKDSGSFLALKRLVVPNCRAKKAILDLEDVLEELKRIRSANILSVLDFRVDHKSNDVWQFDILTEYATRGSLQELLEVTETLSPAKARSFGVELLQALDFLHKKGICHSRVHLGNIMLCSSSTSGMTLKLGDSGFQECLYRISLGVDVVPHERKRQSRRWVAPELAAPDAMKTRKTDVWDAACVIVEMIFGLSITEKYQSASAFMNSVVLSEPFEDLLKDAFRADPKRRPTAFDLVPYEFFRTDAPAIADNVVTSPATPLRGGPSGNYFTSVSALQRSRPESNTVQPTSKSRYEQEWDELGRLGKGGYGEVVKSRNKLDGRVYAIKKITQKTPSELSQVLSEVYLLATLNHPYVVRYFTAWPEEETSVADADDSSVFTSTISTDDTAARSLNLGKLQTSFNISSSAGGLDFISSSGYPKIEFGADTDEEDEDDDDDEDSDSEDESAVQTDSGSPQAVKGKSFNAIHRRSESRVVTKSTLFIQMEFCERQTLRDMIRRGMTEHPEEVWRLLRQVLEGLVHIHSHGMIHRDLKPENIFIDSADNPKIGDFGLATTGQYFIPEKTQTNHSGNDDMTKDVGTTLYVAPELSSNASGHYTDKVDMYSLGIMLFEMCFPLPTAMERMHVLTALRKRDHTLPEAFKSSEKQVQGEIILSLVQHKAAERPSSAELLRSGKIPRQIENDTIRTALEALSDSNSPYFHKMMAAVFSRTSDQQIQEQMWNMSSAARHSPAVEYALLSDTVRDKLLDCFRRHGAVQTYRQGIFPRSLYNTSSNVVQLLDASGALVQLPFDMTLPHARAVAKQPSIPEKTFTFGTVFRDEAAGSAPRSIKEADFDVISKNAKDIALKEAEVMKVVDEILSEFPCFTTTSMCFHISHSGLLDIILGFCRIAPAQRSITKEILGRLNIDRYNWSKIRLELRAPSIGIPSTSLDDLAQFDFRDTPEKVFTKLQSIFQGTEYMGKIASIFTHVAGLNEYLKRLGVRRKVYFSPLSNVNEKFYKDSVMFQCLFDGKKRNVLAAGGRYDHLIEAYQPRMAGAIASTRHQKIHGVGVNIAWERIVTSMAQYQKSAGTAASFLKKSDGVASQSQAWKLRRCDVLIASFDPTVLRSTGVKLCSELWANDVSAELAIDVHSTEELQTHYRDDKHSWWVTIRHDVYGSGKADLRVKSRDTNTDVDVRSADLVSFLRGELRERAHREGTEGRLKLGRHHSHAEGGSSDKANHQNNVIVLVKKHKSKKVNKWQVVEAAQARAHEVAQSYAEGPVISVETRDDILEKVRETRLTDTDSWRRVIQDAPSAEREYLQDLMDLLITQKDERGEECRKVFIYNFRTGMCVDYDLLL